MNNTNDIYCMIYKKYPSDVVYLATGGQLNKILWCVRQVKNMYNEHEDGYEILTELQEELSNKPSYEELLDLIGVPRAPDAEEASWTQFLNEYGLKPPTDIKSK